MTRYLLAALPLVLSACAGGGLSADDAARLAEPHLRHFEGFERWSRRVAVADPAFRGRGTLEETLFAPLRREDVVWGAWVGWGRGATVRWGHLSHPPKSLRWTRIRVPSVGEVEVTAAKLPDPRASRANHAALAPCVLLRRPTVDPRAGAFTMAYRRESQIER